MQNKPLISFITLNFNNTPVTCEFLESTKNLTYTNYEIIVVDNASKEDPTPIFKEQFPNVRVVRSDKNLGFTGGNNLGMEHAKGELFFIINNDTEVTPGMLEPLVEVFEKDSTVGVVCPKIRYWDQKDMLQYCGYTEINPYTGRNQCIGLYEIDHGQHDTGGYTQYAHGAAMLVKREVADRTQGFAELFFIYYEELDWSSRIRRAGYNIFYEPKSLIYHKESVTMGKESPLKAYYHNRNRVLFMRRNVKPGQFFVFALFWNFVVAPKKLLGYIAKLQTKHIKSFMRAQVWHLRNRNVTPAV